ncbi:MAG: pentapeptide repeat-containing protein [Spirochaetes bacterium]|nr:pentapeptide repeat-containing protein [Spirochaetota bacterium]
MCKYFYDGWDCPYEKLPDSEYCIFHLKDDNKDIEEFNKGINEILETDEEIIKFTGFYFPTGTSDFSNEKYHKDVTFENVVFSGNTTFEGAKFSGNATFELAKFSEKTNFNGAEFSGDVYFEEAKFSEDVYFEGTKFSENVVFRWTKFSEYACFDGVEFSGNVYFEWTKFSENASFDGAKFSEYASFQEAEFSGNARFNEAKFSGNARFDGAEFSEHASFNRAKFSKTLYFGNVKLYGIFNFIQNNSKVIVFRNTFFSDNVRIKANLSKCTFNGSNIERVDLSDSIWDENKNQGLITKIYNYFFNSSIIIWEESQSEQSTNWNELEGIYRRLKQSYQKSGDYETAGKFYFQEMECKRKQLGYFHRQFQNVFYRGFCGYGEKPFNVVLISIITMFAFAISYFYNGIEINGTDIINYRFSLNFFDFSWINDFLWSFYTSIITFTTLGYGDVHPVGLSRVFASIESLIGIFMTALFIFVFTRKMLR